jgi:hypothetical protein
MATGDLDYPRLRASTTCPLCQGEKGPGCVACWPCYRQHNLRHPNPDAERIFARIEASLEREDTSGEMLVHS